MYKIRRTCVEYIVVSIMTGGKRMVLKVETEDNKPRYAGSYNRLFPMRVSTNTFITIYMLYLLTNKGSLYGKEIIDKIEKRFKGKWKPSHGLVYPILRELEAEGLVTGEWQGEGSKKTIRIYSITPVGLDVFESEKIKHRDMFMQSFLMIETLMNDLYDDVEMFDFTTID